MSIDMKKKTQQKRKSSGFTLVELIVSVGLFALVMLIATGAYFTLIALDRRARATNQVVSSLSFAVDTMMRGIRTGTNYQCAGGSSSGGNNAVGDCTSFSYTDINVSDPNTGVPPATVVYIKKANQTIGRCENTIGNVTCTDANASSLTDSGITIQKLAFYVRGVGNGSAPTWAQQPHVTFIISGLMSAGSGGKTVLFTIQQGATQRLIDY